MLIEASEIIKYYKLYIQIMIFKFIPFVNIISDSEQYFVKNKKKKTLDHDRDLFDS